MIGQKLRPVSRRRQTNRQTDRQTVKRTYLQISAKFWQVITPCDTKIWIKTIFMDNMDDLLKQCTETFCNMYLDCNVGNYKDKYALLQIRWGEWISKSLVCGTKEKPCHDTRSNEQQNQYNRQWIWICTCQLCNTCALHGIFPEWLKVHCAPLVMIL